MIVGHPRPAARSTTRTVCVSAGRARSGKDRTQRIAPSGFHCHVGWESARPDSIYAPCCREAAIQRCKFRIQGLLQMVVCRRPGGSLAGVVRFSWLQATVFTQGCKIGDACFQSTANALQLQNSRTPGKPEDENHPRDAKGRNPCEFRPRDGAGRDGEINPSRAALVPCLISSSSRRCSSCRSPASSRCAARRPSPCPRHCLRDRRR